MNDQNIWAEESRCLHYLKYGECHCAVCHDVLVRNELREMLDRHVRQSMELWFSTHDRTEKSFESDDLIKFILGEQ